MNTRQFNTSANFYELEPPWFFENFNLLERASQLRVAFDRISESLDELDGLKESLEEDTAEPKNVVADFEVVVHDLIEGLEEFYYCFPELSSERWFTSLRQAVASAHWRAEEGRFKKDPEKIKHYLPKISAHVSSGSAPDARQNLKEFIETRGRRISPYDVDDLFKNDVYEARDHIATGYYSTALLVLGRAVEKALLEIGRERNIMRVKKHRHIPWNEATFRDRTEALVNADHPKESGKMLSKKQYHEISVLIDYRNNVAHTDYEDIGREEAIRTSESAVDLLNALSTLLQELREMDDEEIKELTIKVD